MHERSTWTTRTPPCASLLDRPAESTDSALVLSGRTCDALGVRIPSAELSSKKLIEATVDTARERTVAARPEYEQRLAGVETEIRQAEEALERYFQAFQTGAMSMATGAPRIETLSEKLRALQSRRDELGDLIEAERGPELGPMDVA